MFKLFEGASLKIAKNLIRVTHAQESLQLVKEKTISSIDADGLLTIVVALNACNLIETMRSDFISRDIDPIEGQDIVDDYVYETLRVQTWITFRDGADHMDKCLKILELAEKLRIHWISDDDPKGPGPRYYCVKDVLRRLGNEKNFELHDVLFEFTYTQHGEFIKYFKLLLEPTSPPEPAAEISTADEKTPDHSETHASEGAPAHDHLEDQDPEPTAS